MPKKKEGLKTRGKEHQNSLVSQQNHEKYKSNAGGWGGELKKSEKLELNKGKSAWAVIFLFLQFLKELAETRQI